jgi:hypothetical protein
MPPGDSHEPRPTLGAQPGTEGQANAPRPAPRPRRRGCQFPHRPPRRRDQSPRTHRRCRRLDRRRRNSSRRRQSCPGQTRGPQRTGENRSELKRRAPRIPCSKSVSRPCARPPRRSPSRKPASRPSPSPPKTSRRAGGSRSRPSSIRTGSPRQSAPATKRSRRPRPFRTLRNAAGRWLKSRPSIQ